MGTNRRAVIYLDVACRWAHFVLSVQLLSENVKEFVSANDIGGIESVSKDMSSIQHQTNVV